MVEADIENAIIDKISREFERHNIDGIQILGQWQVGCDGIDKAIENSDTGLVTLKVYPRYYETPTIPTCTITTDMMINIRADVDYNGLSYIQICDIVTNILQEYQDYIDVACSDFSFGGKFEVAGFQLNSGTVGMDSEKALWTMNSSFTIYGVIIG